MKSQSQNPGLIILLVAASYWQSGNKLRTAHRVRTYMKTLNLPYECDTREFKELRRRAHTTGDFETLAKWCQLRAEFYRKKQSACEAELRDGHLPMLHIRAASHSSGDLILKTQLAGQLSEQWSELASFYLAKAAEVGPS